jgi:hypothetical protein
VLRISISSNPTITEYFSRQHVAPKKHSGPGNKGKSRFLMALGQCPLATIAINAFPLPDLVGAIYRIAQGGFEPE